VGASGVASAKKTIAPGVSKMADLKITLGDVTVKDQSGKGKLTQQHLYDWLDEQFDRQNAGNNYPERLKAAFLEIGTRGVQRRAASFAMHKARMAVDTLDPDIVEDRAVVPIG
jgi:hypothetical protein